MKILLPFLSLALLLSACGGASPEPKANAGPQSIALLGPDKEAITLTVEIADDPAEHAKGLMGRDSLSMGEGMLFIFEAPSQLQFWMKDTLISLDILYFNARGEVVDFGRMDPCILDENQEECPVYTSEFDAMYALEVPAGFIETYNINLGWKIGLPSK